MFESLIENFKQMIFCEQMIFILWGSLLFIYNLLNVFGFIT